MNNILKTTLLILGLSSVPITHAMDHPPRQGICYKFFKDTLIGRQECTLNSGTATGYSWTAFSMKNRNAQVEVPDSEYVIITNNMDGSSTLKVDGKSTPAYSFYRDSNLKKSKAEDIPYREKLSCFGTESDPFSICTQKKIN